MMKKLLCSILFGVFAIAYSHAQLGDVAGRPGNTGTFEPIATTSVTPPTNTPIVIQGTSFGTLPPGGISTQHDFQFTSNSVSQLILSVDIEGPDAGEFLESAPVPSSVTGIGLTSIFNVSFVPDAGATAGIKTAWVHLTVAGGPPFGTPSEDFYFQITGTVGAASPSIQVLNNESIEISNASTDPFGNAVGGAESITRQYTIENATGSAPLIIQNIFNSFGDSQFVVDLGVGFGGFPFNIPVGSSFTFDVIFTPDQPDTPGFPDVNYSAFIAIDTETNDGPTGPFTDATDFFFGVIGTGISPSPNMEVFGNSTLISSGDASPSPADHTDFGSLDIGAGGFSRTFTIENNGTSDLILTSLSPIVDIVGADSGDFMVTTNPTTPIASGGGSTTFVVTFDPTVVGGNGGLKSAEIQISNNGDDDPYTFAIQGTATENPVGSDQQLLITQYYQGLNTNDNYIEIKNVSATASITGFYNLALFLDSNATTQGASNITNSPPDFSEPIPGLLPGQVVLFRRSGTSALPAAFGPNRFLPDPAPSEVCSFTGNDVIVITTSTGANTYNDRIDVLGVVGTSTTDWGTQLSLVKGCGEDGDTDEVPAIIYSADPLNPLYDASQFIELTLDEVNNASTDMNIALGTQVSGSTTWTSSWSNGTSDRTRNTIIDGSYTNANGSFAACNLTINPGASVVLDSGGSGSNFVLVSNNLTYNGTLTIGDTEALITTDDNAVISGSGTFSKIERTTPLNNFRDYTYWSSPVSTTLSSVFVGVDPTRIFQWRTPSLNDTGNWEVASGSMEEGRGYLAEAPSTITTGQQHQVTFSGTPNNGLVDVTVGIDLNDGNGYGGYNIVGNPYPSAIDIDLFLQDQANIEVNNGDVTTTDATIWLWTHGTQIDGTTGEFTAADYATYNLVGGVGSGDDEGTGVTPTNIIGSGQGFLIRVLTPGDNTVNFENDMRVLGGNDTQFFKSNNSVATEKNRVWLNMSSKESKVSNQILVGFMDEATDGVDRGYDGLHLGSGNITFYSNLEDNIYAIQGLGTFNQSKEVSLGFYSGLEETHRISIGKAEGILADEDIYLVDNELNIVHDLKQGDYEFDVTAAGNYKTRFTLKFNSGVLNTDDVILNNSFIVFSEAGALKIKASEEISKLKVYDMTGRLLIDSEPKSAAFNVESYNIKAGTVLIMNATMKNGAEISKKAIKY